MSVDYSSLSVQKTIGGTDDEYNDGYMLSQTQHIAVDNEKYYASMMLNRNFRMINISDKACADAVLDSVKLVAGICTHDDDQLIVVDNNGGKVVVCKRDGSYVKDLATGLDCPNGAASGGGMIFIGEVGDSAKQLQCFDADGNQKSVINSANSKPFTGVNYVSYDEANKRVILSDTDGNAVHVFSATDNAHLFSIDQNGDEPGQLEAPAGTTVDKHGNILVCDSGNSRVQVFDKDGKYVCRFGEEDLFTSPLDVNVKGDEVIVLDGSVFSGWSRLQTFNL